MYTQLIKPEYPEGGPGGGGREGPPAGGAVSAGARGAGGGPVLFRSAAEVIRSDARRESQGLSARRPGSDYF